MIESKILYEEARSDDRKGNEISVRLIKWVQAYDSHYTLRAILILGGDCKVDNMALYDFYRNNDADMIRAAIANYDRLYVDYLEYIGADNESAPVL